MAAQAQNSVTECTIWPPPYGLTLQAYFELSAGLNRILPSIRAFCDGDTKKAEELMASI